MLDHEIQPKFSWRRLWQYTGPGFLMSLAYVDPGNLEADLQSGAYVGYQLIWVIGLSSAAGFLLQIVAARIGVVTSKNLAQLCTEEYSRVQSFFLWIMIELAIIGSDIQEVIGSAIGLQILFGLPLWLGCLITGLDTFTFLLFHAIGMRYLEALFCSFIGIMFMCFFVDLGMIQPDVSSIVTQGFRPAIPEYAIVQAIGMIGAIIMPHNLYLHSALVQSRKINPQNSAHVSEANRYFAIESAIALIMSFFINVSVLVVFATAFYAPECAQNPGLMTACVPQSVARESNSPIYNFHDGSICNTHDNCPPCYRNFLPHVSGDPPYVCQEIGLSDAGEAVTSVLGIYARRFWALGLLISGQASTMTGTLAGQYVMEGFLGWKIDPWKRVALTRSIALLPAVGVAIASQARPAESDRVNEWLNVLQSLQLPFALIPLMMFGTSSRLMGSFQTSIYLKYLILIVSLVVLGINFGLVGHFILKLENLEWPTLIALTLLGMGYATLLMSLVRTTNVVGEETDYHLNHSDYHQKLLQ